VARRHHSSYKCGIAAGALVHVFKTIALQNVVEFIAERSHDPAARQKVRSYPLTPSEDLLPLFLETSIDADKFNDRGQRTQVSGSDRYAKLLGNASIKSFDDDNPLPQESAPPTITLPLKRHQKESLAFALRAERHGTLDAFEIALPGCPQVTVLYNQLNLSFRFFLSSATESLRIANPIVRGGLLCDEMGLGKTLVVLSLVAANPPPVPPTAATPRVPVRPEQRWHNAAWEQHIPKNRIPTRDDSDDSDDDAAGDAAGGNNLPMPLVKANIVGKLTAPIAMVPNPHPQMLVSPVVKKMITSNCYKNRNSLTPIKATLVLVPVSICGQWASEIKRCAPTLKFLVYHGQERHRFTLDNFREADIILSTYETVAKQVRDECMRTAMAAAEVRPAGAHADELKKVLEKKRALAKNGNASAARLVALLPPSPKDVQVLLGFLMMKAPEIHITDLKFHRLVLDESQKCTGAMDDVVDAISADLRWAVTGTPINQTLKSVAKLFKAVGCRAHHNPYDVIQEMETTGSFGRGMMFQFLNMMYLTLPTRETNYYHVDMDFDHLLQSAAVKQKQNTNPVFAASVDEVQEIMDMRLYGEIQDSDDEANGEDQEAMEGGFSTSDSSGATICFTLATLSSSAIMMRHIKSDAILGDIVLPPRTQVGFPVTLSADESLLYQQVAARLKEQFAVLTRQDRIGNRMSRVMMWIDMMQRSAAHYSLVSEDRLNQNYEEGAGAQNENAKHNFVPIDPQALRAKLQRTDGVPTSTMEAIVKMGEIPPEVEDCAVCMCAMVQPTLLKCHHFYCRECVLQVISTAQGEPLCPACRKDSIVKEKHVIQIAAETAPPEGQELRLQLERRGECAKVNAIAGLVARITAEDATSKFVIFSRYPMFLKLLEKKLAATNVPLIVIDGSTTMIFFFFRRATCGPGRHGPCCSSHCAAIIEFIARMCEHIE
ncbi:Hypothetical protein, putative, partial [Bodo saltans]